MGVKPVEYVKDSSTAGFAVAGDEKPITSTTANTIQKDVNQGNTKDLDNGQEKYLTSLVDEDSITYNAEEQQNVGKNQINTTGEDGEDLSEKNGVGGAVAGATASAAIGVWFAVKAFQTAADGQGISFGADGWTQAAYGAVTAALAAGTLATSLLLDPNKSERESQTGAAEDTNNIINGYYDTLASDMDSMLENSEHYKELIDTKTQNDVDMIMELGALEAEKAVYASQGNTEKVAEIQKKIDDIKKGAEEDSDTDEIDEIKEGMESYIGNNNESIGVADSAMTVAEFLQGGHVMKTFADINMYAALAAALVSGITAAGLFPKLAPFFPDLSGSVVAKVMYGVAAVLFMGSAAILRNTSKVEGEAGDAGDQMQECVNNLNKNIESQAGFTESTTASFEEGDTQYTETTQQIQEGVDKALQNQGQRLAEQGQPTGGNNNGGTTEPTTPAPTVGGGNTNTDDEPTV